MGEVVTVLNAGLNDRGLPGGSAPAGSLWVHTLS
jgi:hypothetical protein